MLAETSSFLAILPTLKQNRVAHKCSQFKAVFDEEKDLNLDDQIQYNEKCFFTLDWIILQTFFNLFLY